MLMKPAYPTVLDHPRFKVIIRPESRKLTIFFAGTGTADYAFHFYGQAMQCGTNVILVNNGANEWYQSGIPGLGNDLEETIRTIKAWSVAMNAPDIYCIGSSMGGSGAALYGALLNAAVLAFGFEVRIGLPGSRSSRLGPKGHAFPIPDLTPFIAGSIKPFHAYIGIDDSEDMASSAHIRNLPNVNATFMEHAFHGPPKYLKNRGRLRPLIEAFLNGSELPSMPEAAEVPEGYPEALHVGHVGYWTKDLPAWETGYREAIRLRGNAMMANLGLGRALIATGRPAEALQYLAVAKRSKLKEAPFYFAYALRLLGFPNDAIALHQMTLNTWPNYIEPMLDIATAHASQKRFADAVKALEAVLEIDPENKTGLSRIRDYRSKLENQRCSG
jgi:hypothetical protein